MKRLVIGILFSAGFIYLSLRGVELEEAWSGLKGASCGFLLPVAAVFILTQIIRSIRWGVLLSPIKAINQRALFPITSVGFMAIIVAPMRLGEIVRHYLINVKQSVPFGSGLATILIERTMDLLMLLVFLSVVLSQVSLPDWIARSGSVLLGILLLEFLFIILFMIFPEKIKGVLFPITKRFPERVGKGLEALIENIANGFRVISNVNKFTQVFLLSFLVWLLSALAVYLLFFLQIALGDPGSPGGYNYNCPGDQPAGSPWIGRQFSIWLHRCLILLRSGQK
jgi:hypothetical protein